MILATLFRFLCGDRRAILAVASARGSLLLGLLLVLSAGLAREYDGEDLLAEPWHLLLPLGASLLSSLLLYVLLHLVRLRHEEPPVSFSRSYPRFLAVFWMTAPLAWLYAIPVEQFLPTAQAVETNLWLLALVSLWRVLLISRCAAVLFGARFLTLFFPVILFADTVALVVVALTPVPIFNIMGGVRLTDSERVIQSAAFLTKFFGTVTWPVWLGGTLVVLAKKRFGWTPARLDPEPTPRVAPSLWALAACSLGIGLAALPFTQPAQQLRQSVDRDLARGRVAQAIATMSAHQRNDFPRHWDPAPWPGYDRNTPPLHEVLRAIADAPPPPWVEGLYTAKLVQEIESLHGYWRWKSFNDEELEQYVLAVERYPAAQAAVRQMIGPIQRLRDDDEASDTRRRLYGRLLRASQGETAPAPSGQE